MAKYRITSPEGQSYDITAPDDATEDQVMAYARENFSKPANPAKDKTTEILNRRPTAGIIDAAGSLASGAIAGPVSGLAGLAQGAKNLVSPGMEAGDRVRQVQDALTYDPQTDLGKGITKTVTYPFMKLSELADYTGGKTTDAAGPGAGTAANVALNAIPFALGRVGPAGESAGAVARRSAAKTANSQVDAGITQAKEAGYVLPPSQANPSLFNQFVEGIAGKVKTAQTASIKNQEVTNGLVKKGLGLTEDAPLNSESLSQVRKEAGQNYERIRSAGRVTADPIYSKTLDAIAAPFERASKDFPESARTDIISAVQAAKKESFDASSAVDQIRVFRGKADTAYRNGDKELGSAYKGVAGAIEDQLGRHLEASGAPKSVIDDFRKSREIIAKSYTVEKHLGKDGNVDAQGLARELKRKPLSGDIRTAAEFAEQFPKAAQRPERVGGVPMSLFDLAIGGGASALLHNPLYLAASAGRPSVRAGILSKPYQNAFVSPQEYGPSVLTRLGVSAADLQRQPLIPLSEIAEGQRQ